jgi:cytoskeletal protein CcmA (bactofilin family)
MFSQKPRKDESMAKEKEQAPALAPREGVISIIGPGMRVVGDCETEGTLRIEGIVEGTVRAGKAVVVGKDGVIQGDLATQDAVIGGRVTGTVTAESRLELQATCIIEGEIRARRVKLEEGGKINGKVLMGEISQMPRSAAGQKGSGQPHPEHAHAGASPASGRPVPASNVV